MHSCARLRQTLPMALFKDREDVDEWLKNLDYETFWEEIEDFDLPIMTKDHVESEIAKGHVDKDTALNVIKGFARMELVEKYRLPVRGLAPGHRPN